MDNKPVKPGASPHGQAVIPQLSPEMLNRLLETQAREIELRTKQLALQQQQDSNNFEFAKLALEAKTKDRQESRTFGAKFQRNLYFLAGFMALLVAAIVVVALYTGKETVAIEVLKIVAYVGGGGLSGYGIGYFKGAKSSRPQPPE